MSRIGRQPIPVPAGVTVSIEPESVRVNGPKGELSERVHRDIEVTQDGDAAARHAAHRPRRTPRAARPHAHARREHGPGRDRGLREAPRDPGRRLPRAAEGQEPRARRRLLAPGADPGARRDRIRGAPADARRRQGHLQAARRRDRRDHPQAAPAGALQGQGHPLRGRARRSARSASAHDASSPRRSAASSAAAACARRSPAPPQRPRISVFRSNRGLSAQLIDDVSAAHAGGRQLVRAGAALARQSRAHHARRRAAGRARQGRRHLRGRLRPRRLPLPRPRPRVRRGDPRGGHAV